MDNTILDERWLTILQESGYRITAPRRLIVEIIEPYHGRILDPACGSGGMFVQSEKFVEAHGGQMITEGVALGAIQAPPGGQPKSGGKHLGAVEDEESPVIPPMSGPADLVGERDVNGQGNETGQTEVGEELFDPRDELTPG